MNAGNITVIVLIAIAIGFAVVGALILKGSIKVPEANKDRYAKASFGASLVLGAASIVAYFSPMIREKLEARKKANASTARPR